MTFDLIVFPVDRALTFEEASAELGRAGASFSFGRGHDKRLDPFIERMHTRYPGLKGRGAEPPFEFDVLRGHVFVGIPWNEVASVVADVADAAWKAGLAVYDPQREAVGLPSPYANSPMTADGVERHVEVAEEAFGAIQRGMSLAPDDDEAAVQRAITAELTAAGFEVASPLGFEITPRLGDEVDGDPQRVPTALQTAQHRTQLIADVSGKALGPRHAALGQLAGWDADPEVATALRPLLESEDAFEAGEAARGLARQRDITDLPAVLNLVHRMSPADGGTIEAMLPPLRAALDLAALGGPVAVDGVKARARSWIGKPRVRYQSWEVELDRDLEELLGKG